MKDVLISIRPKWCELIANGEKTIEARKTKPKLPTPFKCYIYCTKARYEHEDFICVGAGTKNARAFYGGGKVIGEFTCDIVCAVLCHPEAFARKPLYFKKPMDDACLTEKEIDEYSGGKDVLGWHISDLVIYDEPKKLTAFYAERICSRGTEQDGCVGCWDCEKRPPQSWRYVEGLLDIEGER